MGDTITIRGVTAANATVTVSGLPENPTVTADPDGDFEVTVGLLPGSNVIQLIAHDPVTERDSEAVVRTVQVVVGGRRAARRPPVDPLALAQPAADATITGPVAVAGTGAPGSTLQLTAALIGAATPTFTVTDAAGGAVAVSPTPPTPPAPQTLGIDAAGAFTGSLSLAPGTWDVTVAPTAGDPITRRVTVQPAAGLSGTLRLEGGQSYLELDQDGAPVAGVSGSIADDGDSIDAGGHARRCASGRAMRARCG